jgi:hypothetical protein
MTWAAAQYNAPSYDRDEGDTGKGGKQRQPNASLPRPPPSKGSTPKASAQAESADDANGTEAKSPSTAAKSPAPATSASVKAQEVARPCLRLQTPSAPATAAAQEVPRPCLRQHTPSASATETAEQEPEKKADTKAPAKPRHSQQKGPLHVKEERDTVEIARKADVLQGQQHKLMDQGIEEHEAMKPDPDNPGNDIDRLDARHMIPDPMNREETALNHERLHRLVGALVGNFSIRKNEVTFVIPILPSRLAHCVRDYEDKYAGNEHIPQLNPNYTPQYTIVSGNNFATIARAFLERTVTTEENKKLGVTDERGRLSMSKLATVDTEFASYIKAGLRVKKLKPSILEYPYLFQAVNAGMNNTFTSTGSEGQVLRAIQKRIFPNPGAAVPSQSKIKDIVKTLQSEFYQWWNYIEPMKDFVLKFGDPLNPLVDRLQKHLSAAVNSDAARQSAETWAALALLPAGLSSGVEALIEFNCRLEFVKYGICEGIKPSQLVQFSKGKKKAELEELDSSLTTTILENKRSLEELQPAVRVRVLGKLHSLAAWLLVKGSVTIEQLVSGREAKPETITVVLKTYAQVWTVFKVELLLGVGKTLSDDGLLAVEIQELAKDKDSKRKAEEMNAAEQRELVTQYDGRGAVKNYVELLWTIGVRAGARVQARVPITQKESNKTIKLYDKGEIIWVDNEKIVIQLESGANFTFAPVDYPEDCFQVIQLESTEGATDSTIQISGLHALRLSGTLRMRKSVANAQIICAFDQIDAVMQERRATQGSKIDDFVRCDCRCTKQMFNIHQSNIPMH